MVAEQLSKMAVLPPRSSRPPRPTVRQLLLAALLVDLVLVAGDVAHHLAWDRGVLPYFRWAKWRADLDLSFAELFGYLQVAGSVLLLVLVLRRTRQPAVGAWALVLATIVADDALMIHERGGEALVGLLSLPAVAGLRPADLGELLTWALLGSVLLVVLLWAHLRSGPDARRRSWQLGGAIALLAVFAVGLDMVEIALEGVVSPGLGTALTYIESWGELVSMTVLLALAWSFLRATTPPEQAPRAVPA